MKVAVGAELVLVRLEPAEELCRSLLEAFAGLGAPAATVTGMVGSVRRLVYTTATCAAGNPAYGPPRTATGPIEIGAAQGQLGREPDGDSQLHLHGVFAAEDGSTFGGHVLEAEVLITVELALLLSHGVGWRREYVRIRGSDPLPVLEPHLLAGNEDATPDR